MLSAVCASTGGSCGGGCGGGGGDGGDGVVSRPGLPFFFSEVFVGMGEGRRLTLVLLRTTSLAINIVII